MQYGFVSLVGWDVRSRGRSTVKRSRRRRAAARCRPPAASRPPDRKTYEIKRHMHVLKVSNHLISPVRHPSHH